MTTSTAPGLGWPTDDPTGSAGATAADTATGLGWPVATSPPRTTRTPTDPIAEEHA